MGTLNRPLTTPETIPTDLPPTQPEPIVSDRHSPIFLDFDGPTLLAALCLGALVPLLLTGFFAH